MVVGDLRVVEDALTFRQLLSHERTSCTIDFGEVLDDARTLGVDIVGQELCIDTRIGGQTLLIQRLDVAQRSLGRVAELAVTVHLQ